MWQRTKAELGGDGQRGNVAGKWEVGRWAVGPKHEENRVRFPTTVCRGLE